MVIMIINDDSGTGASCIYPLLGVRMYDWNFLATDVDTESIESANVNINLNKGYNEKITTLLVPSEGERMILKDVLPIGNK